MSLTPREQSAKMRDMLIGLSASLSLDFEDRLTERLCELEQRLAKAPEPPPMPAMAPMPATEPDWLPALLARLDALATPEPRHEPKNGHRLIAPHTHGDEYAQRAECIRELGIDSVLVAGQRRGPSSRRLS